MPERRRDVVSAMHPVTKLAAVVAICLSVFLVRLGGICILLTLVFLGFAAVALGSAGTVGFIALGSKLKKVFIFSLLIVLVQVLFSGQGEPLLALDALPFVVPREGIARGLLLAGRFLTSVAASYLLVLTTDPSELAYGLMRFGLPYRYGFTLVAMMRFLPVFGDEGRIVRHAQLAKGVDLEHAGIRQLPRLIRYL
ncbi:MAG TPA: hypothetical protein GX513_01005, partial [Firmicutes bacterium]|nr:hypothetical protein [Bacillota bacterium]